MLKFTAPLLRNVALAAFVGAATFASPVFAQSADTTAPAQDMVDQNSTAPAPAAAAKPSHMMHKHGDHGMDVEARIKTLHDKLKITSAQEDEWSAVAQTMRDNESATHDLIEQRHSNADSMTAIDDLQSYQQITQAHADGIQKMMASFKTLYADMPDDQKKNADTVFGHFEGRHHDMHGKHHGMHGKKSS